MASAILCVTAFVVLFLCRFILLQNIAAPQQQDHNVFLHILGRIRITATGNGLNGFGLTDREGRAEAYLRRTVALTGATQISNYCWALDVGKTRFRVHENYVVRLRDATNPIENHTCFYVANQEMPVAERIASALLQLKNNPALFDGWVAKRDAFKADGHVFGFRHVLG